MFLKTLSGLFLLIIISVYSHASIMIYPKYIFLDASNKTDKVYLVNPSDAETINYRLGLKHFKQDKDGVFKEEKATDNTIDRYIRFSPHRSELKPKKQQTIKVNLRHYESLPDGDSNVYLVISKMPKAAPLESIPVNGGNIQIELSAIHEVAIPIIIRKGKVNDAGTIENIQKSASFDSAPALSFRLKRNKDNSLPPGIVRGDISVWYEGVMISFIKGKYVLPDNEYVNGVISLEGLDKVLPKKEDRKGKQLTVLFTKHFDDEGIDASSIFDEKHIKL